MKRQILLPAALLALVVGGSAQAQIAGTGTTGTTGVMGTTGTTGTGNGTVGAGTGILSNGTAGSFGTGNAGSAGRIGSNGLIVPQPTNPQGVNPFASPGTLNGTTTGTTGNIGTNGSVGVLGGGLTVAGTNYYGDGAVVNGQVVTPYQAGAQAAAERTGAMVPVAGIDIAPPALPGMPAGVRAKVRPEALREVQQIRMSRARAPYDETQTNLGDGMPQPQAGIYDRLASARTGAVDVRRNGSSMPAVPMPGSDLSQMARRDRSLGISTDRMAGRKSGIISRVAGSREELRGSAQPSRNGEQVRLARRIANVMESRPMHEGTITAVGGSGVQVRFTQDGTTRTERLGVGQVFFFRPDGELASMEAAPEMLEPGMRVLFALPQNTTGEPRSMVAGSREEARSSVAQPGSATVTPSTTNAVPATEADPRLTAPAPPTAEMSTGEGTEVRSSVLGARQSVRSRQPAK